MRLAGAIAILVLTTPAFAQKAPVAPLGDQAKAMLGAWEFSNAERDKICTATFKDARTAIGYRVEFDRDCAGRFPLVSEVAGWTYPDGDLLQLLDVKGRVLTEFSEVEDGIFEAPTPGVGVLFLQNADAAARKPDEEPEAQPPAQSPAPAPPPAPPPAR
jgi:hypothetical protein